MGRWNKDCEHSVEYFCLKSKIVYNKGIIYKYHTMMYGFEQWGLGFGGGMSFTFVLLILWSFFWRGLALWHAAKRKEPRWFIALLLLNTAGILEIIYLLFFSKTKEKK